MLNRQQIDALYLQLFEDPRYRVYGILDGASVTQLPQSLEQHQVEHICLFRGDLIPELLQAAPYLVQLEADSTFTNWVLKTGWGLHWGIYAVTDADLRQMRKHCRTFLMVYGLDGKPLYFRYYDPRVMSVFLPTCNEQELKLVFGPVVRYVMEGENPNHLVRFWNEKGQLKQERTELGLGENLTT